MDLLILVLLGTQDKEFKRLLEAVDKEIIRGNIKEKVVAQAGYTKYTSPRMEIVDFVPNDEFDKLIDRADLVITHGGAGSILSAIKKNKPVIAAARLSKFKEHTNDHQKQIVKEFADAGYIIELRDFNKLGKLIEKAKEMKVKKFQSNTKNMVNLIDNYITEDNHTSWFNKYRQALLYLMFGGFTTLVNILTFYILRKLSVSVYISNMIAWITSVLFAFVTNKLFVFESRGKSSKENVREVISFWLFRLLSLGIDMAAMYLLLQVLGINEMISKILVNVIVIVINYVFSKVFVFKK